MTDQVGFEDGDRVEVISLGITGRVMAAAMQEKKQCGKVH